VRHAAVRRGIPARVRMEPDNSGPKEVGWAIARDGFMERENFIGFDYSLNISESRPGPRSLNERTSCHITPDTSRSRWACHASGSIRLRNDCRDILAHSPAGDPPNCPLASAGGSVRNFRRFRQAHQSVTQFRVIHGTAGCRGVVTGVFVYIVLHGFRHESFQSAG